jgi:hypothetical protein
MCLAVLRLAPDAAWPVLLASVRDEALDRPTQPPGAWWDDADVVGGRDVQAGGTWLAVDRRARRVAAVFTPAGQTPVGGPLRSRGALPLVGLSTGGPPDELTAYAPFALLVADLTGATWWAWDGDQLAEAAVSPGVHVGNIHGLDMLTNQRQARWLPRFCSAVPDGVADGSTATSWAGWHDLLVGGLEPERADALLLRHTIGDRVFGTKSAALVGLSADAVRYDAADRPWEPAAWQRVC